MTTPEQDISLLALTPEYLDHLPAQVTEALAEFLQDREEQSNAISPVFGKSVEMLRDYVLSGGKRIRPTFAWVGFSAANGWRTHDYDPHHILEAISSLELIQACALIHDDYIDSSDTRRGNPTVHRQAETFHARKQWNGDTEHFGASISILLGDLAMVWADDMLRNSGLPYEALSRAAEPWEAMRTEVIGGQILDIVNEAYGCESVEAAQQVNRFKTAAYTIERPLHIGAALADASPEVIESLRAYGRDIGVAFQLRDDLLGVFGDPSITGKPAGDDLREGKRTVLIAEAVNHTTDADADFIRTQLGSVESPEEIAELARLIGSTGAVELVEERIAQMTEAGLAHLNDVPLTPGSVDVLVSLAEKATARHS